MVRLLILVVTSVLVPAYRYPEEASITDLEALQGAWTVRSDERSNDVVLPERLVGNLVLVQGDQYQRVTKGNPPVIVRTLRLNTARKPKTIDLIAREDSGKEWVFEGIYELHGDTFKACFAAYGRERPTDFRLGPGSSALSITTYQRKNR